MTKMNDPLLLIISSPSGAGKTTLTRKLLDTFQDSMAFSVSHTTRAKRKGEVEGQDYHFTDKDQFLQMVAEGRFAEWAQVHDNYYGTSIDEIERAREQCRRAIVFDIDHQGARQIKAKLPRAVGVFILPPSMGELRRRLEGRATDAKEVIERRFAKAKLEIEHYLFFDYIVVNEDVEHAHATLRGIVHAELARRWRMAGHAESLLRTGKA